VRVESGIREGSQISIYYDPMISKLVTHGKDRQDAIKKMRIALDSYVIRGVTHNIGFLRSLCDHSRFIAGNLTTGFIPEEYPDGYKGKVLTTEDKEVLLASAFIVHSRYVENQATISGQFGSFNRRRFIQQKLNKVICTLGKERFSIGLLEASQQGSTQTFSLGIKNFKENEEDNKVEPKIVKVESNFLRGDVVFTSVTNGNLNTLQVLGASDSNSHYSLQYQGSSFEVEVRDPSQMKFLSLMPKPEVIDNSRFVVSPMPGAVQSISVKVGDQVSAGQEVCVVEAMKMQNALRSERAGKVKAVHVTRGKTVNAADVLVEFE